MGWNSELRDFLAAHRAGTGGSADSSPLGKKAALTHPLGTPRPALCRVHLPRTLHNRNA